MRSVFLLAAAGALFVVAPARAQYYPYDHAAAQVRSWYHRFLDRNVDWSGYHHWTERLRRGESPCDVLGYILGSYEYYTRAGYSPEGFVNQLFLDLAGRPPTPEEFRRYVRRAERRERSQVARELLHRFPGACHDVRIWDRDRRDDHDHDWWDDDDRWDRNRHWLYRR